MSEKEKIFKILLKQPKSVLIHIIKDMDNGEFLEQALDNAEVVFVDYEHKS